MSAIRFSVVIPTRERAETLQYALRTCLDQQFDDYEIVVSDNHSSPATRAVVDAAGSPKVRYVRTAEPVAMSNNWEFGLSHARGEYVLVIGDDDGLLPHALRELDRLTRERGAKVVQWTAAYYTWPTIAVAGQGDYLRVPLGRSAHERDGHDVIREVAAFRAFYTELPMLYNAAVHRDVLDQLRRRTGRVFPHHIPDVYSGFAVAHAAGRFLSTSVPMTVSGQSGASNGIATLFNHRRSAIDREFHALNAKDGLRCEPTVPDLPVFPHVPVADSFAFAKRVLFPELDATLDRRALAAACVKGARVPEADWPEALAMIHDSLADVPDLRAWFAAEFANAPYQPPESVLLRPPQLGSNGEELQLDAAAFGVCDVAAAARLCDRVLNYRACPPAYEEWVDEGQAGVPGGLPPTCDPRDRAVLRLHLESAGLLQTCRERAGVILELTAKANHLEQQLRDTQSRLRDERRWSLKTPLRAVKRLLSRTRPAGR